MSPFPEMFITQEFQNRRAKVKETSFF